MSLRFISPIDFLSIECLGCSKHSKDLNNICSSCHRRLCENCVGTFFLQVGKICIFCQESDAPPNSNKFHLGFLNPIGTNTCWLNACLQMLMALTPFKNIHTIKNEYGSSELFIFLKFLSTYLKHGPSGKNQVFQVLP